MVHTSGSLSLAVLEVFVHLPPPMRSADKLPALTAVAIRLPDDSLIEDLPPDFASLDDPIRTQSCGDIWVRERRSLALRVPSLVVRPEWNLLLNPEHPDMTKVAVLSAEPFALDRRLGT